MKAIISKYLEESLRVIQSVDQHCGESIARAADHICHAMQAGNKLLICGNGGSAADCQHVATEFVVRFQKDRTGLPAIALTTDTSILTACSNDFGFQSVFSRQIEALGRPGDVLLALSTSGTSENVVGAMETAKSLGLVGIAMTGMKSGPLTALADVSVQIQSDITARVQESHIIVAHIFCEIVEQRLFQDS
ncbi:D-sedoheptulose 7-phosphate isomerase [bacterium]|nr:D-sedoheptulose 7-phosphate isomerase [bacterium]